MPSRFCNNTRTRVHGARGSCELVGLEMDAESSRALRQKPLSRTRTAFDGNEGTPAASAVSIGVTAMSAVDHSYEEHHDEGADAHMVPCTVGTD